MTHPACEFIAVFFRVHAGQELLVDRFKLEFGVLVIAFVAIHAGKTGLKPELVRMGKACAIFIGMAIRAHEGTVV
jgi:hypothetical protein